MYLWWIRVDSITFLYVYYKELGVTKWVLGICMAATKITVEASGQRRIADFIDNITPPTPNQS